MVKKVVSVAALALALAGCDHENQPGPMNEFTVQGAYAPGSYEDFKANAGDRVFFALNSAMLSKANQAELDRQIAWLQKYSAVDVTLEGHCDDRGTDEYNLALGDRRADAVKRYMVKNGIAATRINTVSFGKARPSVMGNNEAAWAQNRRTVTVVYNN